MTPDVEQVREALGNVERLESWYEAGLDDRVIVDPFIVEAARLWVESQDGPLIWWCEEHRCSGSADSCWKSIAVGYENAFANGEQPEFMPCLMVEYRRVPVHEHESHV